MKKYALILIAALFSAACGAGVKTVVREGFNTAGRVAVMPFSGKADDVGLSLSEAFTTYLMDAGFDVIERAQMESVLKEHKISLSGAMAPETMAQLGRLAGVSVIVTGSYVMRSEEIRTVTRGVMPPGRVPKGGQRRPPGARQGPGDVRVESNIFFSGLTVKFVDVNTGRVLMSTSSEKDYNADSVNKALASMAKSIRETLKNKKGEK